MRKLAIGAARAVGHAALWPLERALANDAAMASPPIFIVGPPRSGTSLVYEALVTRYRFAFMSNLAHRFYLTPVGASWLGRPAIDRWRGNFTSRYGHIAGWGAPNEGGWIWRRWLIDGDWQDESTAEILPLADMRRTVAGLAHAMNAPFVNKNVMHANRLRLMNAIWPNALFIEVRRAPKDNIRSIVRAERKAGGPAPDAGGWWSVRPSIAPQYVGADDVTRAVAQVLGVRSDIECDGAVIGPARIFRVEHEQLCLDPRRTLDGIAQWLSDFGVRITERGQIPERFENRSSAPLPAHDEATLARAWEEIGRIVENG